jgi:hypothetical protein
LIMPQISEISAYPSITRFSNIRRIRKSFYEKKNR